MNRPAAAIESIAGKIGCKKETLRRWVSPDELHAQQPNLLYSVLVLPRFDVDMAHVEIVLNQLFVFHEAIKGSGRAWPLITEAMQERGLQRVSGRARFIGGLNLQLQAQAVNDAIADCREVNLLAHVFGMFRDHGLLGVETEAVKMMLLCALNLVECIGEAVTSPSAKKA